MTSKFKNMSLTEFREFVSPSLMDVANDMESLDNDSPFMSVLGQVLLLAQDQVNAIAVSRMGGRSDILTPDGLYAVLFLLGVLCERHGWAIPDEDLNLSAFDGL